MASDRESREREKNKNGAAAWRGQNAEGRKKSQPWEGARRAGGKERPAMEAPARWGRSFSSTCLKEPTAGKMVEEEEKGVGGWGGNGKFQNAREGNPYL
jgi:hypothetical protein